MRRRRRWPAEGRGGAGWPWWRAGELVDGEGGPLAKRTEVVSRTDRQESCHCWRVIEWRVSCSANTKRCLLKRMQMPRMIMSGWMPRVRKSMMCHWSGAPQHSMRRSDREDLDRLVDLERRFRTSMQPMMRAGTPAAVQPAGTGASTTLPAAIWRRRRSRCRPALWRRHRTARRVRTWDDGRRVPCRCRPG